jgi:glutamyl-tRNA reductase
VNEQNKNANRRFQTAGERLDDILGDASARIEEETQTLIAYINDELVPAIRQHSSNALRVASEKLSKAADHMESNKQKR